MALLALVVALVEGGSSASAGSDSSADLACRNLTRHELADSVDWTALGIDSSAQDFVDSAAFQRYADFRCHRVCPVFGHGELKCSAEPHHDAGYDGWSAVWLWEIGFLAGGASASLLTSHCGTVDVGGRPLL